MHSGAQAISSLFHIEGISLGVDEICEVAGRANSMGQISLVPGISEGQAAGVYGSDGQKGVNNLGTHLGTTLHNKHDQYDV